MSTDPVGDYNMDLMAERANIRFQQSISENPYFYYGPFTGTIARNAGYIFAGRLFANHSSENPAGVLSKLPVSPSCSRTISDHCLAKETLKSFFAISGEEGRFKYNYGWERIPENWHKVPVDYGLVSLNLDTVAMVLKYPQLGRYVLFSNPFLD